MSNLARIDDLGLFQTSENMFDEGRAYDDESSTGFDYLEADLACGCSCCEDVKPLDGWALGFEYGLNNNQNSFASLVSESAVVWPTVNTPLAALQGSTVWGTGAGTQIKYYFANNASLDGTNYSNIWSASEKAEYVRALDSISSVADISFVETNNINEAHFIEAIASDSAIQASFGVALLGYHVGPADAAQYGYALGVYNDNYWTSTNAAPGGFYYGTIVHEIGHGLGLGHAHDIGFGTEVMTGVSSTFDDYGSFDLNQGVYTMMSYNDGWDKENGHMFSSATSGNITGPMALDIAALQNMYGANTTNQAGDSLYDVTQYTGGFSSIWDAGGIDTLTAQSASSGHYVDLRAANLQYATGGGGYMTYSMSSTQSGLTFANAVVIENAIGSAYGDVITGNSANNTLSGLAGDDAFFVDGASDQFSEGGHDRIIGGNGVDTLNVGYSASAYAVLYGSTKSYLLRGLNIIDIDPDVESINFNGTVLNNTLSDLGANEITLTPYWTGATASLTKLHTNDVYVVTDLTNGNDLIVNNGGYVSISAFDNTGWDAIFAGSDGSGGYNLIWQNTDGSIGHWQLDANGVRIGGGPLASIYDAEILVNYDINSDGTTGHILTAIENDASDGNTTTLGQSTQDVYVVNDGSGQDVVSVGGSPVSVSGFSSDGWSAVHASSDGSGGYNLIWQNTNGSIGHWQLDANGARIGGGPLASIYDAEILVNYDINDDGTTGYILTAIENDASDGNTTTLSQSTQDVYVVNDGSGQDVVSVGGSPVSVSGFSSNGWSAVHASSDGSGGYNLIWQNTNGSIGHWQLDANGARIGGGPLASIYDAEVLVNYDINDDGTTGHILTAIENDASDGNTTTLSQSTQDVYVVNDGSGQDVVSIGGSPVSVSGFSSNGWSAVHASSDGSGGYNLIWQNTNGSIGHWQLDANGARIGGGPLASIYDAEILVNYDINDDGTTGHILTAIENDASDGNTTTLSQSTQDVYVVNDGSGQDVVSIGGSPVSVSGFSSDGWSAVHASSDGSGGYNLIWQNTNGSIGHWQLDANGVRIGGGPLASIYDAEVLVNYDINDDGTTGHILTAIENDASDGNTTTLSQSTQDVYVVNDGSGQDVVSIGGSPVSVSGFSSNGWSAVHASSDGSGGYNLIWQNTNGSIGHWQLDANGVRIGGGPLASIYDAEVLVNYDINDDGTTGHTLTAIENDASDGNTTTLSQSTQDVYVVNDGSGQDVVSIGGSPVSVSGFSSDGWSAVHASSDGSGGYNLIWQNTNGSIGHWQLDANGARIGGGPLASIYDAEVLVNYDINDDGFLGMV